MANTNYDIVPTCLAVKAMRDNGYRNTSYAIAELIDNSIQAGASQVELLCAEEEVQLAQRKRARVAEIAVLDNGSGMNADVLRIALQFGNGTHLGVDEPDGIGRFGMGLPSSSISQCRRVDVWSWQDGVENALHSYLDLNLIEQGELGEVPRPVYEPVPDLFCRVGTCFDQTGTLVVWSQLDRLLLRTATAITENSEFVIGRMYRRFIAGGNVRVRMVAFDRRNPKKMHEQFARPNDPMYLMEDTSCDAPFDHTPMFIPWGETEFLIRYQGGTYPVKVNFSVAKEEARIGYNPGSRDYGQHAKRNVGVSIMRADRELDLDPTWSDPSEPRDRWWGVEVDFPPALDDLFGVTNSKQSARNFTDLAKIDIDELLRDEEVTLTGKFQELTADEDPRAPLLEIAQHIKRNINTIRRVLKAQPTETRKKRYEDPANTTEAIATVATEKRKEDGHVGTSDDQETLPAEQRQLEIEQTLVDDGLTRQEAQELAAATVGRGFKYSFASGNLSSPAFFDVKSRGGAIIVTLNIGHPAYPRLMEVLEQDIDVTDIETLINRLTAARDGIELLLMAWARYEDEQHDGPPRDRAQNTRWDWGRIAKLFLEDEELPV